MHDRAVRDGKGDDDGAGLLGGDAAENVATPLSRACMSGVAASLRYMRNYLSIINNNAILPSLRP